MTALKTNKQGIGSLQPRRSGADERQVLAEDDAAQVKEREQRTREEHPVTLAQLQRSDATYEAPVTKKPKSFLSAIKVPLIAASTTLGLDRIFTFIGSNKPISLLEGKPLNIPLIGKLGEVPGLMASGVIVLGSFMILGWGLEGLLQNTVERNSMMKAGGWGIAISETFACVSNALNFTGHSAENPINHVLLSNPDAAVGLFYVVPLLAMAASFVRQTFWPNKKGQT